MPVRSRVERTNGYLAGVRCRQIGAQRNSLAAGSCPHSVSRMGEMVRLLPSLYFPRFPLGHAYLWLDDDGMTLVDCGVAGSGEQIAADIRGLGRDPADVRHLVLTHFHHDHVGAANEVATPRSPASATANQ
jgi:glyoxylase-like metal-dependent hydrolase (beta-lactamase superfamily II)